MFLPLEIENLIKSYLLQCPKCTKYVMKLTKDNKCYKCVDYEDFTIIFTVGLIISLAVFSELFLIIFSLRISGVFERYI